MACSSGDAYQKPKDPEEAGSDFIRAALDGDYRKVRLFVLKDRDNERLVETLEKNYRKLPEPEKRSFREASVIVTKMNNTGDSVMLINFSNSYKKTPQEIKLVRYEGEWWVDLKYTFTGNTER